MNVYGILLPNESVLTTVVGSSYTYSPSKPSVGSTSGRTLLSNVPSIVTVLIQTDFFVRVISIFNSPSRAVLLSKVCVWSLAFGNCFLPSDTPPTVTSMLLTLSSLAEHRIVTCFTSLTPGRLSSLFSMNCAPLSSYPRGLTVAVQPCGRLVEKSNVASASTCAAHTSNAANNRFSFFMMIYSVIYIFHFSLIAWSSKQRYPSWVKVGILFVNFFTS